MPSSSNKNRIFRVAKITKDSCLQSSIMKAFVSLTSEDINIDGMINYYVKSSKNKTISAFHTNFFKFKQTLCFKRNHRKTKIDSILKKCKSKFFRTVQEALKDLLENYFPVPHLPQSFITNINIDTNKKHLHHSLKDILKAFDALYDFDGMIGSVPYSMQKMVVKFMSMTYRELFEKYIDSKRFMEDSNAIREKEGEKFELLYRYVAKIFVQYYSISKGNKTKHKSSEIEVPLRILIDVDGEYSNQCNSLIAQHSSDVSMTEIDSNHNYHKGF